MNLFPKKKNCEVTFIEEHVVIIRGEKFFRHDHEYAVIKKLLISLHKKTDKVMATQEQFKAALARIDTATTSAGAAATAIQGRIDALVAAIGNAGLTPEVEAELLAQTEGLGGNLETLASALTAMGKTPENPVPEPIPDPVPPVEPPVEPPVS